MFSNPTLLPSSTRLQYGQGSCVSRPEIRMGHVRISRRLCHPIAFLAHQQISTPYFFWRYINLSIICWYMGYLFVGINSAILMYFLLGFIAQWYLRKYYPVFFVKCNYIVSAALDGGTQVMVFILTFAVFGGSGKAHPFPTWPDNPDTSIHNLDYCA
ncbi:hypothetical protein F5882DRAFT_460890 [Hyaloscypha sp. PMI_1271]|nr:hypothetical protein F5882DRAFT_460890 [Hyaloscypha sp. PMI_1271]